MARVSFAAIAVLLLSGCASSATLYPANDIARSGGVLKERLTEFAPGNGPARLTLPDGEVLTGQYSATLCRPVRAENPLTSIYAANGVSIRHVAPSTTVAETGSPAVVDFTGPKGTTMHCEVYNNNYTGRGTGACKASTGATYRVQY